MCLCFVYIRDTIVCAISISILFINIKNTYSLLVLLVLLIAIYGLAPKFRCATIWWQILERVTDNISSNLPLGFLKFGDEPIWSPRVKFAVEPAKTGDGRFLHIRSCYNNKYLVMNQIESNTWIVAAAKKPEEDDSKDSCTLFEPYSLEDDETTTVRLRSVQLNRISPTNSFITRDGDTHQGMLVSSIGSVFNAIDWKSVLILPSQVAFRSEELDGNYLRSIFLYNGLIYQKFESGLDRADPLVANELLPNANGSYRIKDLYTGKFWRRRDNWIKGEPDDKTNETLFSIVNIQDNVFGVRNLGNNNFCGPFSEADSINCLCARFPNLSRQTRLIVEECVIQREITDIVYRLTDARIYDEQIIELTNGFGHNDTSETNTLTLNFSATISSSRTWNNSTSINFGVKVSMSVTIVPLIVSQSIELSTEFGFTHEWGVTETTETKREASYTITIPPFTKMKVAMMCTKGTCDVPFSYTQRDLLTSGTWVSTRKDDGLFTGTNAYNFYFQSTEVRTDDKGRMYF